MGFFSWITQDTSRSISNNSSRKGTFTVFMHDNKGNVWQEDDYEGYGIFGGKDFYELLAEMNGVKPDKKLEGEDYTGYMRYKGINLAYSKEPCLFPNLTQSKNWTYDKRGPMDCPNQGFFY